ncbi:response regulator transcription factor [Streptomyces tuirus]|uniref:Response regulator transcription factor n=1 Tax=Streptomyces tuirus TaxID=68278 RepID=A0A941FJ81_9ACTN|nr:response regulator transcription factor [Streptomyces tuirus]
MILETQSEMAVIGTAGDGEQALRLALELRPDVLLLDVRMPGRDGLWTLAEIAKRGLIDAGDVHVLMLTTFDIGEYVDEALDQGASGFLLKSASYEELLAAVRAAATGNAALSPRVARRVIDGYVAGHREETGNYTDQERLSDLTPRELEILGLLGQGFNNAEIASRLVITEHTVKSHVSRLLAKTGCRDRGQAAALARRVRPQGSDP